MKICDILKPEHILCPLEGKDKTDIIKNLINILNDDENISDIKQVTEAVLEREKIMSTGVGKGLAIPHAKTKGIQGISAAFGIAKTDIDFEALDGEPVRLVFLLVGEEKNVGAHIKLLSRISRMMNNDSFRENLLNASVCEDIYPLFEKEEAKYDDI